jgi:hypothetical protein
VTDETPHSLLNKFYICLGFNFEWGLNKKMKEGNMSKTKCLNILVKKLCEKEKGKKQLNAGNAREVIKVFVKLLLSDQEFNDTINNYCELVEKGKK